MAELIGVVPKDYPRLDLKLYTKIFDYLLEQKEYKILENVLQGFPSYLIN